MKYKFGIDFGTTNTSIALCEKVNGKDEPFIFTLKEKVPQETIPSLIYIDNNDKTAIGDKAILANSEAIQKQNVGSYQLVRKIKLDLEKEGFQKKYSVGSRNIEITDMLSFLFGFLKHQTAEQMYNIDTQDMEYDGVVMGVPVHFGDEEKCILRKSLFLAGFYNSEEEAKEKTEFVSEPIAVAINYGLDIEKDKTVLVFDFGGGTLDVAIVNLKNQVNGMDKLHPIETLAKKRITLGGEELTKQFFTKCILVEYGPDIICSSCKIKKSFEANTIWENIQHSGLGQELITKIDDLKCDLSKFNKAELSTDGLLPRKAFLRKQFEKAISNYIDEIEELIDDCICQAGLADEQDIDDVVIAGGSSLIPCIQELLTDKFGRIKVKIGKPKDVMTSIVQGLAIVGLKEDKVIDDVVDNDYGIWDDQNNRFLSIIYSGTSIRDTQLDRICLSGKSIRIKAINSNAADVVIKIKQKNLNGIRDIGEIAFDDVGSGNYRLFMSVDPDKGMLVVNLYDEKQRRWTSIPLSKSRFKIKK